MKQLLLILFFTGLIVPRSEAQLWKLKRLELSGGLGISSFFADVGGFSNGENIRGFKDITVKQTRYSLNASAKYLITERITGRVSLSYASLHATDERGDNPHRGFESTTTIIEPALIGEYYILRNKAANRYLFNKGRKPELIAFLESLDIYAFTGIGGLAYSIIPNERLDNYKPPDRRGFTGVVPVGIGGMVSTYPNIKIGVEMGWRYTFTDNLDGYTSQYSSYNDVYYFLNLTFTYRIKLDKDVLRSIK